jgi:hypothetical protein
MVKKPALRLRLPTIADQKRVFITELARFLVENQVAKGIGLQMEVLQPKHQRVVNWAADWARLRNSTNLFGYPTVEEAETQLTQFLK